MSQSMIDNQSYEDRRVDQGVANYYQLDSETSSVSAGVPQSGAKRPRHFSHRGGRGFRSPSDSELDEHFLVDEPIERSPGDIAGLHLVREALSFSQLPEVKALPVETRKVAVDALVNNRQRQLLAELGNTEVNKNNP